MVNGSQWKNSIFFNTFGSGSTTKEVNYLTIYDDDDQEI